MVTRHDENAAGLRPLRSWSAALFVTPEHTRSFSVEADNGFFLARCHFAQCACKFRSLEAGVGVAHTDISFTVVRALALKRHPHCARQKRQEHDWTCCEQSTASPFHGMIVSKNISIDSGTKPHFLRPFAHREDGAAASERGSNATAAVTAAAHFRRSSGLSAVKQRCCRAGS